MKHGYVLNREFHRDLGLIKLSLVMRIRKAVTRFSDWTHTPVGDFVGCAVCYAAMLVGMFMLMLWGL